MWKRDCGAASREQKDKLQQDNGIKDKISSIVSKKVENLLPSSGEGTERFSNKNERQQDDGTIIKNAVLVMANQVNKFLLSNKEKGHNC